MFRKKESRTHEERIHTHLVKYGHITSWESIKLYGNTRLSHYIYVLREKGMNITDVWVKTKNRYGDEVKYKRYILEKR